MRIIVIGAVNSTLQTINQLIKHQFNIVGILGHEPINSSNISGWVDLKKISDENELPYKSFRKINEAENIIWAKSKKPDIIFAVGFSQLLSNEWLEMPRLGCIGFHPTKLPRGRGRAPLAWTVLEEKEGAATFFLMGEGADDGPIFVQEVFQIEDNDDAHSVNEKINLAIVKSLDIWLPKLKNGIWDPIPQDETKASWYGKRNKEDGHINWNYSAYSIDRLIKASTKPHPGAYTYFDDKKIIIWESVIEKDIKIHGVNGRILIIDTRGILVQCGDGLIWLKKIEAEKDILLRVGDKLGYNIEDEINRLRKIIRKLGYE